MQNVLENWLFKQQLKSILNQMFFISTKKRCHEGCQHSYHTFGHVSSLYVPNWSLVWMNWTQRFHVFYSQQILKPVCHVPLMRSQNWKYLEFEQAVTYGKHLLQNLYNRKILWCKKCRQ